MFLTEEGKAGKLGPGLSRWEVFLIGSSPLMIFFALDGNFNMQSLLPQVILLVLGFLSKCRDFKLDRRNMALAIFSIGSCALSSVSCLMLNTDAVTNKTLMRLCYVVVIVVYFYVVVNRTYTTAQLRWIVVANVVCGAIIAAAVLLRMQSGATGKIAVATVFGSIVEENYMGALLAFELILGVSLVRFAKGMKFKALFAALCVVIAAGLFYSGSRGAFIGSLVGICVMLLCYLVQRRKESAVANKLLTVALLAVCAGIVLSSLDLLPSWYLDRYLNNSYSDSSNSERLKYWAFGLQGFFKRKLFGYGVGNYSYYLMEQFNYTNDTVVAHNTFLDVLIDTGIVGACLFCALVCRGMRGLHHIGPLVALFVTGFFVAFIVGGERTFFLWNSIVLLNLLCAFLREHPNDRNLVGIFRIGDAR